MAEGCTASQLSTENQEDIVQTSRSCGHEPSGASRCENSRDHKSIQTEKVPVRHTAVQFEQPTLMDEEATQMSERSSQTEANPTDTQMSVPSPPQPEANHTDMQMTAASSVNVESSSGTQIGGGNSIVNNNQTYNVTNNNTYNIFSNCHQCHPTQHDDFIRWAEQQALESENQSPALPPGDVTDQVPDSHSMRKIKTVTSRTVTQTSDDQVQTVTSRAHPSCSPSHDVQSSSTNLQQAAKVESTEPKQIISSDHRSEETEQCSSVQDSICIIDSSGQTLVPGDAVWIGNRFCGRCRAIYIGHQQVVLCRRRGDLLMVEKEELNLTRAFGKLSVIREGECRVFPPRERIRRATSRVETIFTEGDGVCVGSDFHYWVYTGVGAIQARNKGFRIGL